MRKLKKRYSNPMARWDLIRIEEEGKIIREFGLEKKREIYITTEILRKLRRQARELIATKNPEKEKILIAKLLKLGILKEDNTNIDAILALTIKDILSRRLQAVLVNKAMASTQKQARQMIVHGLVGINGRKCTSPSYLVPTGEENIIVIYKAPPKPIMKKQSQPKNGTEEAEMGFDIENGGDEI